MEREENARLSDSLRDWTNVRKRPLGDSTMERNRRRDSIFDRDDDHEKIRELPAPPSDGENAAPANFIAAVTSFFSY